MVINNTKYCNNCDTETDETDQLTEILDDSNDLICNDCICNNCKAGVKYPGKPKCRECLDAAIHDRAELELGADDIHCSVFDYTEPDQMTWKDVDPYAGY